MQARSQNEIFRGKRKFGGQWLRVGCNPPQKMVFKERRADFASEFTVKTKKKVFTELKADFTRTWQTQDILLHQSDVSLKSFGGKVNFRESKRTNVSTAHAHVA